jgi:hypothetical protein
MKMTKKAQALVAAILIILIGSVIGVTIVSLLGKGSATAVNYIRGKQALFIADGGLEYYLEQLNNQSSSWSTPPTKPSNMALGIGTFTITTSNAQQDSINVTSTATVSGADNISVVRVVSVTATRISAGAPAAFAFFLRGNSPSGLNFTGSTGSVTGNLSSAGNISGIPVAGLTLNGTSSPDSLLDFPTANYAYYQGVANTVISGNYTFSANTTYNGIYYVTGGNVTFQNNVKLYGTIVLASANKSIIMNNTSGVVIDPSLDSLHPGNKNPAIVSAGVISAESTTNLSIKRLVYTDKNSNPSITFRNSTGLNFFGTIVSQGGVNVRSVSNLTMVFDSDILVNPPPGFSGGGTGAVSATLWDEVY